MTSLERRTGRVPSEGSRRGFWHLRSSSRRSSGSPKRRGLAVAAVLSGVAILAAACSSSTTPSKSKPSPSTTKAPILLGMITPLTGAYQPLGINDRKGAELAVSEINAAGGIDGRQIKLIVENDNTTPSQAVTDLKSLVGQGVVAVVGSSYSNDSLAAEPIAERDHVPYVSTAASVAQVEPVRKYVFMSPPTTVNVGKRLLEYFQYKGWKRVAIAYESDSAFALSGFHVQEQLASKYGVTIVTAQPFTNSTTNFSTIFTHVQQAHAQALMVWGTAAPPVIMTKQFAAAHIGIPLVMSHAEATYLYANPVGAAGNGVIVASAAAVVEPYLPASPLKTVAAKMVSDFEAKYHVYPPQFAFDAYDAVELIAAAAKKDGATRAGIDKGLQNMSLLLPEGDYRMSPTNHSGLHASDISVDRIENSNFTITAWAKKEFEKTFG
jgi:branched-chain amino acid transport system substrate-binding protein